MLDKTICILRSTVTTFADCPHTVNANCLMIESWFTTYNIDHIFHRWALYPPGRVPGGVMVHVNDEDGDVDIETPTSLQVMHLILYFFSQFF